MKLSYGTLLHISGDGQVSVSFYSYLRNTPNNEEFCNHSTVVESFNFPRNVETSSYSLTENTRKKYKLTDKNVVTHSVRQLK